MYNIKEKNAQVEGLTILELNWKKIPNKLGKRFSFMLF